MSKGHNKKKVSIKVKWGVEGNTTAQLARKDLEERRAEE